MAARQAPQPPIALPQGMEHGTSSAVWQGCRCADCLDHRRARARVRMARHRAGGTAAPIPLLPDWHGTENGYVNHGCRCRFCALAHAHETYMRRHADCLDPATVVAEFAAARRRAYRLPQAQREAVMAELQVLVRRLCRTELSMT